MKKYLKMSDFVVGKVQLALNRNFDVCVSYDCADPDMLARKTMDAMEHVINSHDELVAMNKELLAIIYGVIEAPRALGDIAESSDFSDGYMQCSRDTSSVVRDSVEKIMAKAAS